MGVAGRARSGDRSSFTEVQMPKPHPKELRERVVAAYLAGEGSFKSLGKRFKVGEASVNRWVSLARRAGSLEPKRTGGWHGPRKVDEAGEDLLRDLVDNNPDCTLKELGVAYKEARGVEVSTQTMSDTLKRLGYTRKRGSSAGGQRTGPTWSRRGRPSSRNKPGSTPASSSSSTKPA
jgi:transposase